MRRASELAGFAIDPPLVLLKLISVLLIASNQLCSVLQLNEEPTLTWFHYARVCGFTSHIDASFHRLIGRASCSGT